MGTTAFPLGLERFLIVLSDGGDHGVAEIDGVPRLEFGVPFGTDAVASLMVQNREVVPDVCILGQVHFHELDISSGGQLNHGSVLVTLSLSSHRFLRVRHDHMFKLDEEVGIRHPELAIFERKFALLYF